MSGAHKNRATEIISVAKKGATALSAFASNFEVVNEIISPTKSAADIMSIAPTLRRKLFPSQTMQPPVWRLHGFGNWKIFPFTKATSCRFSKTASEIISFAPTLKRTLCPFHSMQWPVWPLLGFSNRKLFLFETPPLDTTGKAGAGASFFPLTPVAKQPRHSPTKVHAEAAAAILPIA